jgi:hypothetical protein
MLTDALCTSGLAATQSLSIQMDCNSRPTLQLMLAVMISFRQLACMKTVAYGGKSKTLAGSSTASLRTGMLMHHIYHTMMLLCCIIGSASCSIVMPYMLAIRIPQQLAVMSLRSQNRGRSAKCYTEDCCCYNHWSIISSQSMLLQVHHASQQHILTGQQVLQGANGGRATGI